MIAAATTLNARPARTRTARLLPQLGYLVGAVEEGADGIHADLVRRLNASARFSDDGKLLPGRVRAHLRRGLRGRLAVGMTQIACAHG